ncbi:MAG: VOC family protein [Burkholderiales bacterium]|nr:VOC family protein [Burkholderiales bacterium]
MRGGGAGSQSPPAGQSNLDHIAHFVPDRETCRCALLELGFSPTPFSLQYHRLQPHADLAPAGTGNHCVMLRQGYIECLVPIADTPVANQLRAAMARYIGVHSIVFGSAAIDLDHARLTQAGFAPLAPIALERPIDTPQGGRIARFSVLRVPPGMMAEGRIQFCRHHTEGFVWQSRWLEHPNGAIALRSAFACVAELDATAERYARFTGLHADAGPGVRCFELARGRVVLYERAAFARRFGIEAPAMPWLAGCELLVADIERTRALLQASRLGVRELGAGSLLVQAPDAIGGLFLFSDAAGTDHVFPRS